MTRNRLFAARAAGECPQYFFLYSVLRPRPSPFSLDHPQEVLQPPPFSSYFSRANFRVLIAPLPPIYLPSLPPCFFLLYFYCLFNPRFGVDSIQLKFLLSPLLRQDGFAVCLFLEVFFFFFCLPYDLLSAVGLAFSLL